MISIINIHKLGTEHLAFKPNPPLEIKGKKNPDAELFFKNNKCPDWPLASAVILSSIQGKSMRKLTWK